MQILNEYTKVAYSDGWLAAVVVFAALLIVFLIVIVDIIFDKRREPYALLTAIMLASLCFGALCGSLKMADQGEEHYIQCVIDNSYPASELMKYEIVKTEGKIITLKGLSYEHN